MTPNDVVTQFYKVAPWLTNKFSDTVDVVSAKVNADGLIELVLSEPLGDEYESLHLAGGMLVNPITSAANTSAGVWRVTTEKAHFEATPTLVNDNRQVLLNGEPVVLMDVPQRNAMTITSEQAPSGAIFEPVWHEFGYCKVVARKGNAVSLQPNAGYVYEAEIKGLTVARRLNVAAVKDIKAARKLLGVLPENKCFAFVVMGDFDVAKKGKEAGYVDDAGFNRYSQLTVMAQFTVVVVWPPAAGEAQGAFVQEAHSSMYDVMNQLFYGADLAGLHNAGGVYPIGSGMAEITDGANYAHAYEYQSFHFIDFATHGVKRKYTKVNVPIRDVEFGGFDGGVVGDGGVFEVSAGNSKAAMPLSIDLDNEE